MVRPNVREGKILFIILPTYNGLKHAKIFIHCLNNQSVKPMVVCVDSGSDGTGEWVRNNIQSVILKANSYWGGSLRLAYDYLKNRIEETDTVLIVNIDRFLFDKDYLSKGIEYAKRGTMVVSAGYSDVTRKHESGGLHVDWKKFSFRVSDDVNICGTTGLFMNGRDFTESGGFSKLLPHHWSDTEFVYRQKLKLIAPKDLIIWIDAKSTGIDRPKNLKELFSMKCSQNPIYKSIFIIKSCPLKYIPINLLRAWYWIWRVL